MDHRAKYRLIVAVTEDWAIGKDGDMLVRNPDDLKRFKRLTTGHTVIMGRRTLESLPGGRPLPHRENIVLTRNGHAEGDGAGYRVARGLKEAKALVAPEEDEVFVIGGETVYRSLLPCVDECLVTLYHVRRPDADTWFPNLDAICGWRLAAREPGGTTPDGTPFDYLTYVRE